MQAKLKANENLAQAQGFGCVCIHDDAVPWDNSTSLDGAAVLSVDMRDVICGLGQDIAGRVVDRF